MIFLLACFGFWVTNMTGWAYEVYEVYGDKIKESYLLRILFKLLECTKCFCFWLGLIYFAYETRHIGFTLLYAGLTSALGIILTKLYRYIND